MSKIKQIQEKLEMVEKLLQETKNSFNMYKLNVSVRYFLIKTDFIGNIKDKVSIQKFKSLDFNALDGEDYFTFDQVKEQILNYDFRCMTTFLNQLHTFENYTKSDNTDKRRISNRIVETNISKPITNKKGKVTVIQKYKENNYNPYMIQNLDVYMKRMKNVKIRPLTKSEVVTLVNAIIRYKNMDDLAKGLNCASSTLGKFLAALTKIGILNGDYKKGLRISKDCILLKKLAN